ncbi:protein TolR [Stutzerimonas balearica]|uniref:protein TolR n=1 Tax=Stutzerimonas balearica TaxID=74829 RepID=UPI000774DAC8|nr:protein TolR [Stutzerimonas balearica]OMG63652.1 protein TolR [Stutzerimonas balearica]
MLVKPQRKHGPKAEMNVVPYIDVMLVLLVIFMVTAPMLVQGVKLELPKVAAEAMPVENERQILTLSVKADGTFYWNLGPALDVKNQTDSAVDLAELRDKVAAIIVANGDTQVYVRADQAADYGRVVAGIAELQRGGVVNLGLITEAPAEPAAP